MARERPVPIPVARAEPVNRLPGEAQPIAKGESAPQPDLRMGRSITEPSSLELPSPAGAKLGKVNGRPHRPAPPKDLAAFRVFKQLCDDIFNEVTRFDAFLVGNEVSDEGAGSIAEIEELLERLYRCPFGQGESLKRVVVAVQSQLSNAHWERPHVEFLKDVIHYLRVRYVIDEASVRTCYEMMKARGLDPFRGTICEPHVVKRYRIEEVKEDEQSNGPIS